MGCRCRDKKSIPEKFVNYVPPSGEGHNNNLYSVQFRRSVSVQVEEQLFNFTMNEQVKLPGDFLTFLRETFDYTVFVFINRREEARFNEY
jgi:hypothetical protein